jgi:hypothetical protein
VVEDRQTLNLTLVITMRTVDNFPLIYRNDFEFLKFEFEIKKIKATNYTKFSTEHFLSILKIICQLNFINIYK